MVALEDRVVDMRFGVVALVAVLAGAVTGGIVTANFAPPEEQASSLKTDTEAIDTAKKEAAEARAEAVHWQNEADRLARELAMKKEQPQTEDEPTEAVEDFADDSPVPQSTMDASMRAELEEYRARDREREERSSERRGDMVEWQNEMINRRTNMFTELIERTDDPAEQQRWADIERQMTLTRELFEQMRNAETDEERAALRETLSANGQTMQNLLKEQQNAVLGRALQAEGIDDPEQLAQIQKAVHSSLSDTAFQMSGRGGPGGGRGWGGGPGRGGPGGRGPGGR